MQKRLHQVGMTFLIVIAMILSVHANAGWFSPKTFEECVADATSALTPKVISGFVMIACHGDQWSAKENECVLDNLEGVKNEYAAKLIVQVGCLGRNSYSDSEKRCLLDKLYPTIGYKEAHDVYEQCVN